MGVAATAHAELLHSFYAAFQRRDYSAMAACYTPDAEFHDPVFQHLNGWRIAAMWRMLCERATDLRIEADQVRASAHEGSAHWDAWYTFTQTGRFVHNSVQASFLFRDGRIRTHRDAFNLYAWTRQALGIKGVLLGWTPFVQRAIQAQASHALDTFCRTHDLTPH